MVAVSVALLVAGAVTVQRLAGAWKLSVAALCLFVIDGFVSNYMLFGEPRLSHPAMNIVISTTALFFLSLGRSELRRKQ